MMNLISLYTCGEGACLCTCLVVTRVALASRQIYLNSVVSRFCSCWISVAIMKMSTDVQTPTSTMRPAVRMQIASVFYCNIMQSQWSSSRYVLRNRQVCNYVTTVVSGVTRYNCWFISYSNPTEPSLSSQWENMCEKRRLILTVWIRYTSGSDTSKSATYDDTSLSVERTKTFSIAYEEI